MQVFKLREYLPKSLFGRALLILVLPIVLIQFTVGGIFADRIFGEMTQIMSSNYVRVINQITSEYVKSSDKKEVLIKASELGIQLSEQVAPDPETIMQRGLFDLTGLYIERALSEDVVGLRQIELEPVSPLRVYLWVEREGQSLLLEFPRRFVSARNPHQLPIIMVLTSILLTAVSVVFLRNQITPIAKLADAAEAFGKGRVIPMRPRGATEVRSATRAFLDMRARIERHIDQRTLMLSGVSHDLRTPLTRLKLGLSFISIDPKETEAMTSDISDMENIIDEFLDFAGEDQDLGWETLSPAKLVEEIVQKSISTLEAGKSIDFKNTLSRTLEVTWRKTAVVRALSNMVENAVKYGNRTTVSIVRIGSSVQISIEDDGVGIHPDDRERALNAFERLDKARNQNKGGGAGLV